MDNFKRILKNTGASFLTRVSAPLSSFILVFFIARYLGVSGVGVFSSAFSLFYIFQAFAGAGLSQLITREVAQNKSDAGKYLINSSFILLILSSIMAGVMSLAVNYFTGDRATVQAVHLLSIALIPDALATCYQSICRAFERFEYITISVLSGILFKLIAGLAVLLLGQGLNSLMIVIVLSVILNLLVSFYFTFQLVRDTKKKLEYSFCKWIIKSSPYFALILIVGNIRMNVDVLILTKMLGEKEVGLYSVAIKLMNICNLGVSSYIMAVQPVLFRLFKTSPEKYKKLSEDSIRYLFMLVIPMVVGTTLLSDRFVLLLFQDEFLPSAKALRIVIWILIFYGMNAIFANALIASNNQKINFQAYVVNMLTNIALTILMVPKYGFIGAAIAGVCASFIFLCCQYSFVSKHLFKVKFAHILLKPVLAAIVMGIIVFLLRDINLFITISVAAAVYIPCLFLFKAFTAEDIHLLNNLRKR